MSVTAILRASPAARTGLSIAVATGVYGVSFGALAVASGISVGQACALSLLMFSGGSQFAMIGVLGGGGTPASALGAATLLGLRNGVYGMQVKAMLNPSGWRRFGYAQMTIDESTATALSQEDPDEQRRGFLVAGIGIFILWNLMTLVGALAGDAMGDPKRWGLDGAAVAAFLGLLWPRLRGREPWAIAVLCALVTVLCLPLLPPGIPILVAGAVAGLIGWLGRERVAGGVG